MAVTSVKEIFDAMPSRFQPALANGLDATVQFDLTGEGGGQWVVAIANQQCTVTEGTVPNPTATFSAAAADYVAMINGALNPMNAFMQGKIRVKGDMGLALKMQKIFGAG